MSAGSEMETVCRRIEALTTRAWPAVEEEHFDGWLLRAANGYTGRANSVCAVESGVIPPAEKIARVERWYAARGLPPKFRLNPLSLPPELDRLLEARGYLRHDDVHVMACSLEGRATSARPVQGQAVDLTLDEWMADRSPETIEKQGAILTRIQPTHWLLGWKIDGHLAARVLGVLEDGWVGIYSLSVPDACRRRGFGRAIMAFLLNRAWEHGALNAYLQMVTDNMAATGLYTSLGFTRAYDYWYRVAPVQAGGTAAGG